MKLSSGQGAAPFRRGGDKKALECGNAANFSKEAIHMKKILKRNLSVLLAVFMLLSCWVFVAPEQAKAIVDQEMYEISVFVNIKNENDRDDNYYTITYIRPNGTTGSVKKTRAAQKSSGVSGNSEYREDTFSLEGIPTRLDYCCNGYEESTWYVERVNLNSGSTAQLFLGKLGARTEFYSRKTQGWIKFDTQEIYLEDHGYDREYEWTAENKAKCVKTGRPYVNKITTDRLPEEVQIPNESGLTGDTPITFNVADQFGVRLGSKYYTVSIEAEDTGKRTSIKATTDDSVSSSTLEGYMIHVSEEAHRLQTVYNTSTHTWGGSGSERYVEPMTLTVTDKKQNTIQKTLSIMLPLIQPAYEVFFEEHIGGDGIVGPPSSVKDRTYSLPLTEMPTADRVGHTFLGFFQGNGGVTQNANNIPSSFGTRVTANTIVIGKELLDSNNRPYRPGDENHPYRAGWAAAPCTVTIRNNKRQTVATYTGQYGYTLQNSINTGYNLSQLQTAAAYVKGSGESGEFNDMRPVGYTIKEGKRYINSSEQTRSEAQLNEDFRDVILEGDIVVDVDYAQVTPAKFTVNFYDTANAALDQGTSSRSNYSFGDIPTLPGGERNSYIEDNTYTYAFAGWAKQRHSNDRVYFVDSRMATDPKTGEEYVAISDAIPRVDIENTPVDRSVNYVAVYSRMFKDYSATFHYTKDGDEQIAYTQENAYHFGGHITPPERVTRTTESGEITEDPEASFIARGYTWNFAGWYTQETGGTLVTFNNLTDSNAMLNDVAGRHFWAHYTQGEPTKNLIRFLLREKDALTVLASQEVNYSLTDNETVPALAETAYARLEAKNLINYDTETTRYTFDGWVNIQNGQETPYSELPITPANYYPSYIEKPLHTIYIYNGDTLVYSFTDVPGAELDTSAFEENITSPTRAGDAFSETYEFKGYSTESGFLWTEGESLVDLDSFVFGDDDVYLYAHYDADPTEYHVRFFEDEAKTVEIADRTLHFGDEIVVPELTEEQTTKEADYYYKYSFMGWNLEPAKTCFGDVDYYLTFRNAYQYYTVKWLNYDGTEYATDRYIYMGHMHQPYKSPEPPIYNESASMANVFDYWYYVNADGEDAGLGNFTVGSKLGGAIQSEIDDGKYTGVLTPAYWQANENVVYLRAHYTLTDNYITITKYDGISSPELPFGQLFDTIQVISGTTLEELDLTASNYVLPNTDEVHYKFARWQKINGNQAQPIANTFAFTEDTSIVESFTTEPHGGVGGDLWNVIVSKYPTFTEEGVFSRSCTAVGCGYNETTGVIGKLQDTTAPTGTLYVKDYKWSSYLETIDSENPQATTLNGSIILNADDMADNEADTAANRNAPLDINYNRKGTGSGVATIDFSIVSADSAPSDPAQISTWYTVFTADGESAPNASLMIRHLISVTDENNAPLFPQLENGDKFVVYARITDSAAAENAPANVPVPNVSYLRSDVLVIDDVAPTIEITSTDDPDEGDESAAANRIRHCEDATITITDTDLASVTLNGNRNYALSETEVSITDVAGKTEYTVGEGDAAVTYELTDNGLQRAMDGDNYLYQYNANTTGEGDPVYVVISDEAADKTTYTPEVPEPGEGEEPAEPVTYELTALYVYRYNTAEEGADAVYETVNLPKNQTSYTTEAGTFTLEPLYNYTYLMPSEAIDLVELVGEGLTITKRGQYQVIATDKAGNSSKKNFEVSGAHKLVTYVVDATCTSAGLNAKRCTVCGKMPPDLQEVIPALGHEFKHRTVPATCTVNGREYDYCERCGIILEDSEVTIEAEGHEWQSQDQAYVLRPATCVVAGVLRYKCLKCGTTKNEPYAALDPQGDNYNASLAAGTGEEASVYGHSLYASQTLPATCTEDGDVSRECKYCGNYFVMQVLEATGHKASTTEFEILEAPDCVTPGSRVPYCANGCGTLLYEGEFEDNYVETVPALGHDFVFVETVEPSEESEGYDLYECSRCDAQDHQNIVPKIKMCDVVAYAITVNTNGEFETTEVFRNRVQAGTEVRQAELNGESGETPALESNETFRYLFRGWSTTLEDLAAIQNAAIAADANMPKDDSEEASSPDEPADSSVTLPQTVNFPLTVEDDTTLYTVFMPKFVNYTIRLYKEDGVTHIRNVGYLHYGNVVSPRAPAKAEDAYGRWDFAGWQKMNPAPGEEATATANVLINGDASYKATYQVNGEIRKYKVFWIYGDKVFAEATVEAGQDAVYNGPEIDPVALPLSLGLKPTAEEHFYFVGWSGSTTNVTESMYVSAKFEKRLHTLSTQSTTQTCTTGEGTRRICTACEFVTEEHYNKAPLGHDWRVNGAVVNPVVHQDGTFVKGSRPEKCSRCGETRVSELDPVKLDVTVKNTEGTPLQGAKVTAYFNDSNDSKIMSATSGADGVAHLLVPVAGKYRIVVEYDGRVSSGTVDVNESGKITGGAVPVISSGSQAPGCPKNCTCHKSGLWPTIYRFIHRFIYTLTRTKCCPDANY